MFGQESALRAEIRAATSREYDRSLAFRAMEALRNYAQHSDLPVHGAVADSGWDVAADRLAFSFVPQLRKIQLTKDRKFKSSVLAELFANEEHDIDLTQDKSCNSAAQSPPLSP